MIIRADGTDLLFITQPDHAHMAAEAIAGWRADDFDAHPRRAAILLAAREHDNGWLEEDAAPVVDAEGRPLDFVRAAGVLRQRVWPRAVDRVSHTDPYAAALVAQHALTVYSRLRGDADWTEFFHRMAALRDRMLAGSPPDIAPHLSADYAFVNAADRISLAFCTGWPEPLESYGRRIILVGNTVQVIPDPFAGARVSLRIRARRLPARRYSSDADVRAALHDAPTEMLEGVAAGSA